MEREITSINELENLISKLSIIEFEDLIKDIISSLNDIESVNTNIIKEFNQFDIVAHFKKEHSIGHPGKWIIELKKYKAQVEAGLIEQFNFKILKYKNTVNKPPWLAQELAKRFLC